MPTKTRRGALQAGAALLASFAGCTGAGSGTEPPADDTAPNRSPADDTMTPTVETPTSSGVRVQWSHALGTRVSRPVIVDGMVVAGTQDGDLVAFDADSGDRRWHHDDGGSFYDPPVAADGVVYAPGTHTLYALDGTSGDELWSREWAGYFAGAPTVSDDRVFVGNSDLPTSHTESAYPEDLWALDRTDGSVTWRRDLGDHRDLSGAPVLADGTLYAQLRDSGAVFALDPADGTTRWQRPVGRANGPLALAGDRLFASGGNALYALDPATGETRWRWADVATAPVVADDSVVFADRMTDPTVVALGLDGEERWSLERDGDVTTWTALSAGGGTVYLSVGRPGPRRTHDDVGLLYAIDATTGDVHWRFVGNSDGFSRVRVHDDTVYAGQVLGEGRLLALQPE